MKAARTPIFSFVTSTILSLFTFLSVARVLAVAQYYRGPMPLVYHLQYYELPALAIYNYPEAFPTLNLTNFAQSEERMDISILKRQNLTLCYGKEWYRFPSSFLIPEEVRVEFIKSGFDGILPKHFVERRDQVEQVRATLKKRPEIAAMSPTGFNNQNLEEKDRYVSISVFTYEPDLSLSCQSGKR